MLRKTCNQLQTFTNPLFEKCATISVLLTRLVLGWVFIESGYGKLRHLDKVIAFFTELAIPFPHIQAPFVASVELLCGLSLLLGIGTRLSCIFLTGVMVVALITAKREEITQISDLFGMAEFLYILLFIWILGHGPGPYSKKSIL